MTSIEQLEEKVDGLTDKFNELVSKLQQCNLKTDPNFEELEIFEEEIDEGEPEEVLI